MESNEALIRDYYGTTSDSFWQWHEDGEAVEWRDGKLIAFSEELSYILKHMAQHGLPRFGSLLLLMAATRDHWAVDGSEAGILASMLAAGQEADHEGQQTLTSRLIRKNSRTVHDSDTPAEDRLSLLQQVLQKLHSVRALDRSLRNSLEAKAALASLVFDSTELVVDADQTTFVADAIRPGLLAILGSASDTVFSSYGPILLLRDLADLAPGLDKVTPEAVRLRLKTGLDALPLLAPIEEEPEQVYPSDTARAVIQELLDSPQHVAMANLAKQLIASATLPRKLSESQEHEMGGYSDIANRGTPDRLLLSELAQDGLTLAVRVAMNEAMYLHRETPPSSPRLRRELLIDSGVRAWGIPRVLAAAAALAFAANTPRGATFGAYRGSGSELKAVDLLSKEGLIDHLAALEPDPHLGNALPQFASQVERSDEAVEAVVLMPADSLAEPALLESLRDLKAERVYVATLDRQGEFRLCERGLRGDKLIRRAVLSLDEVVADGSRLRESRDLDNLPASLRVEPFPLRMPSELDPKTCWSIGNWGALSITGDGRLLRWTNRGKGGRTTKRPVAKGATLVGRAGLYSRDDQFRLWQFA